MATAELINPMHSEDRSPTKNRPPQRRTALLRQQLSLDIPTDNSRGLSSSLPSPITKKELSFLKAIHQNEKNKRQKLKDSNTRTMDAETVEADCDQKRDLSPQDTLSPGQQRMRPRSASLFSPDRGSERGTPKRKSLRLSRSRPSSAKLGRSRSRADSFRVDETTTEKVEAIMANIKTQLTQFSEEDVLLQERLNKLTDGINVLINSHFRKCRPTQLNPIRSVSSGTPRKPGKVVHWKDMMEIVDKSVVSTSAPSSESEPNLLSPSCNLSLPTVTISSSSSDTDISTFVNGEDGSKRFERRCTSVGEVTTHKILKLSGMGSCSSSSSPPPVCTIVIEEPDGQIHQCPTPSSLVDDEVFVL